MSLPNLFILLAGAAVTHWLHRRLRRVEHVSGAWRVQPPWVDPTWYETDAFDEALALWDREMGDAA